jgi:hypothetical protein
MDNSFFLRSHGNESVKIQKFQICTWEFNNKNSLIEFGIELNSKSILQKEEVILDLYIPWLKKECEIKDFYYKLKDSGNSRFIFNDSVSNTISLDGGQNSLGVIHEFSGKDRLCILPVKIENDANNQKIRLTIKLDNYKKNTKQDSNAYIRIGVETNVDTISTKKKGIGKSTIIYDVKLNESRNVPTHLIEQFTKSSPCTIDTCFCFHIIPNSYDITFLESDHLKNVRTLEFKPFKTYLDDSRLKKDELIVVFSKKRNEDSYTFFSIYTKELIGVSQFAIAILINIICAFLFALPTIRTQIPVDLTFKNFFQAFPIEYSIALLLALLMFLYFFFPTSFLRMGSLWSRIISSFYEKKK